MNCENNSSVAPPMASDDYYKASSQNKQIIYKIMSELRKANIPQSTYFITLTIVGWIDIFTRKAYVDNLIKNLKFCQNKKGLEIFECAIMRNAAQPSHIYIYDLPT